MEKIKELSKLLVKLDKNYRLGLPEIVSDIEYDSLCQEYRNLYSKLYNKEKKYISIPKWENDFSSLLSTYEKEEITSFVEKTKKKIKSNVDFIVQPKIDGISVTLIYINHTLFKVFTRGNKKDITDIFLINNLVPEKIEYENLELRGELCIKKDVYNRYINHTSTSFVSARNLVAGMLARKKIHLDIELDLIIFEEKSQVFDNEISLKKLKEFKIISSHIYTNSLDLDKDYEFPEEKSYNCDGLVVKIDSKDLQNQLGHTSTYPRWSIAKKSMSQEIFSEILDIELTVGKTGKISVIGIIKEKKIFERKINKILLHNLNLFKKYKMKKYDKVFFTFKGDSVCVFKRHESCGNENLEIPDLCPFCKSKITTIGKLDYCINDLCKEKLSSSIQKSAKVFNLDKIGKKVSKMFVDKGYKNIYQIIMLEYEELLNMFGSKKIKTAWNIFSQLSSLGKLDIDSILKSLINSEKTVVDSFVSFLKKYNLSSLEEIHKLFLDNDPRLKELEETCGKTKSYKKIKDFFSNKENTKFIQYFSKQVKKDL